MATVIADRSEIIFFDMDPLREATQASVGLRKSTTWGLLYRNYPAAATSLGLPNRYGFRYIPEALSFE
jgi:hypothetical protein